MSWQWGPRRIGVVVGVAAGLIMVLRLFVPTTVGLSGGEQALRIECATELRVDRPAQEDARARLHLRAEPHRWQGEVCDAAGEPTSHVAVVRLARLLGTVAGSEGVDLRVVGLLLCAAFGLAIGLVAWALPTTRAVRFVVSGLLALPLLDQVVAGTLVSLHGDGTGVIALTMTLAAAVCLLAGERPTAAAPAALAAAAAVLLTATPQAHGLLPVLVAALVARPIVAMRRGRHLLGIGLALTLVALVVGSGQMRSEAARTDDRARQVAALVEVADDPARDLAGLGVDREVLAALDPSGPLAADERAALGEVGTERMVRVVAGEPRLALGLARRALDATATFQLPSGLSSYPGHERDPYAAEARIGVVSISYQALDALPALLLLLWVGVAVAGLRLARRGPTQASRGLAWISVGAVVGAVSVALLAAGVGGLPSLGRHVLLAQVLTVWCLPLLAAAHLAARRPPPPLLLPPADVRDAPGRRGAAARPSVLAAVGTDRALDVRDGSARGALLRCDLFSTPGHLS